MVTSIKDRVIFLKLLDLAKQKIDKKIKLESKGWFLRKINGAMWTTIFYTIFHTTKYKKDELWHWWTAAHEIGHIIQCKKWTRPVFLFLYAFPLSLGGVLLITSWLPVLWSDGTVMWAQIIPWILAGGVCFIPQLPDPWRTKWETACYAISMWCYNEVHGRIPDEYIEDLVDVFAGMGYFITEPRKGKMRKILRSIRISIYNGETPKGTAYVYEPVMALLNEAKREIEK